MTTYKHVYVLETERQLTREELDGILTVFLTVFDVASESTILGNYIVMSHVNQPADKPLIVPNATEQGDSRCADF